MTIQIHFRLKEIGPETRMPRTLLLSDTNKPLNAQRGAGFDTIKTAAGDRPALASGRAIAYPNSDRPFS